MAHEDIIKEAKNAALKKNIPHKEIEKYLLHEGLDNKEAKHASEQIKAAQILESAKKAQKESHQAVSSSTQSKSSGWFWIILILIIAAIVYLYYSGVLSFDFINFK